MDSNDRSDSDEQQWQRTNAAKKNFHIIERINMERMKNGGSLSGGIENKRTK